MYFLRLRYQSKHCRAVIFNLVLILASMEVLCVCEQNLWASNLTVIDLQPWRTDTILDTTSQDKLKAGFVRLINLNPNINTWYILDVTWPGEEKSHVFHLENPDPYTRLLFLDKNFPTGLRIVDKAGEYKCDLWAEGKNSDLLGAEISKKTFAPICQSRLFIRNETEGSESAKEWVADFLRSNVWGGEQITTLVKDYLYKDKFLLTASSDTIADPLGKDVIVKKERRPVAALVSKAAETILIEPKNLGISLATERKEGMLAGKWYPIKARKGVFASIMRANLGATEILESYTDRVQKLDKIESEALSYLVAFDLKYYDLGFSLGTRHPSAEWSDRAIEKVRIKDQPGPDGIGSFAPLNFTGKISPLLATRTIATFTGGFKRSHSAFKWGPLSLVNGGSHYGFLESGVILSKLQPNLATIVVFKDGSVDMNSWQASDQNQLANIVHARQNGVPIIEYDHASKSGIPGSLVGSWMNGNWSGSIDSKQRALRAAACIQEIANQKYLIYGYFSSVTPNAMARIFQTYQCKFAIHLDMNALEHTYLAVYEKRSDGLGVEHLIEGMSVLDKKSKNQVIPRFVGNSDNRDFFYLYEKE